MEKIKIKTKDRIIDADSLYTVTEYGRLKGLSPTRVRYNMLAENIPSVKINGIRLIILEEEPKKKGIAV